MKEWLIIHPGCISRLLFCRLTRELRKCQGKMDKRGLSSNLILFNNHICVHGSLLQIRHHAPHCPVLLVGTKVEKKQDCLKLYITWVRPFFSTFFSIFILWCLISGGFEGGWDHNCCLESKRAGPYQTNTRQAACNGTRVREAKASGMQKAEFGHVC